MARETAWKRLLRWLPAAAWYAVIWLLSAQTGAESQSVSDGVLGAFGYDVQTAPMSAALMVSFLVRKAAHMGAFFVLTGLLVLALWRLVERPALRGAAALGLCAVLAGLDEFHQTFVPGRSGTARDALVDILGGACFLAAWAVVALVVRRRAQRREKTKKAGQTAG